MLRQILVFLASISLTGLGCNGQDRPSLSLYGGSGITQKQSGVKPGQAVVPIANARQDLPENAEVSTHFEEKIRPLLQQYCGECHSPGAMEGLDFLADIAEADLAMHRGLFAGVVEQMESGAMPPKDFNQPSDRDRKLVVDWIKKALDLKPDEIERVAQYVVEVYEDRKGNLWFGTTSKGAGRYDGKSLTWFSTQDGLPSNVVTSFAEDLEGNLWLGTHRGLCTYDGKTFTKVWSTTGRHDQGEGWMGVQADQAGTIWTSTNSGVFRFDGESFAEFEIPLAYPKTESYGITAGRTSFALEDKSGNLWFQTDGHGAIKFDGKAFTRLTKEDGLCSNNVNSILQDRQGNIWFACMQSFQPEMTGDGGLCRYDGRSFTKFPDVKGLSQNDIYTIYETRAGDLWIGATGVGAYRYDGRAFTLFDKTDRLHATRNFGVQAILEARNGTLWFGFSGGLFRFNGHSFWNVTKDGPWQGVAVTMSKVAVGEAVNANFIHASTRKALNDLAAGRFKKAQSVFAKLKQDHPNETTIQERSLTMLGYQLINMNRLDLALEVFRIGTELHPGHFNAFDSLGEAYLRNGNEQLAIKNYEKSLQLNPENHSATVMLRKIAARQDYAGMLAVPQGWVEEVIVVPPSFAPTMSLVGMEHLRLPPEFRNPDSPWFCSYILAIDLTKPAELNEGMIADQLLVYFRGLASGGRDKDGKVIETDNFSISRREPTDSGSRANREFTYLLNWQEPFVNATPIQQRVRVKVVASKNKNDVLFVCASPQDFGSPVWRELLEMRSRFERLR